MQGREPNQKRGCDTERRRTRAALSDDAPNGRPAASAVSNSVTAAAYARCAWSTLPFASQALAIARKEGTASTASAASAASTASTASTSLPARSSNARRRMRRLLLAAASASSVRPTLVSSAASLSRNAASAIGALASLASAMH